MKKFFLAYAWILLSTGIILTSIAVMNFLVIKDQQPLSISTETPAETTQPLRQINSNVTGNVQGTTTDYQLQDARASIVSNFLERHNSPLKPYDFYGELLVELADENEFDFRLLPAMAMQESNLCKSIPDDSFNCLGFGIHSRGTLGFDTYEDNFRTAADTLKRKYIDIGLTTPEEIMTKYTPLSDGSWANAVNQFMAEMKYDDRSKGKTHKTNASVLEFAESSDSAKPTPTPSSEPNLD